MSVGPDLFLEAFDAGISEAERKSPSYPRGTWDRSGRVSKDAPNKRDEDWWRAAGPKWLEDYTTWRLASGWKVAVLDGKPAIELELNFKLGKHKVNGYIDRVYELADGSLLVHDIKTGTMVPASTQQLGLYACGIEILFGVRPKWGNFWFPDKGPTEIESLDCWSVDVMSSIADDIGFAIESDIFPPHPTNMCVSCSVRDHCYVRGGENAQGFDPLATPTKGIA